MGVSSDLLKFHMLGHVQCSESIVSGSAMETLQGAALEVGCDGDQMTLNGNAIVTKKDQLGTNGVVHYVSELLIPDSGTTQVEHQVLRDPPPPMLCLVFLTATTVLPLFSRLQPRSCWSWPKAPLLP